MAGNQSNAIEISTLFPRLEADLEQVRGKLTDWGNIGDKRLAEPIRYYVKSPGRLFRPALLLTSAYLVDPHAPSNRLVTAAVAGELLHLATLCHDDLCDAATTRRGSPSLNAAFGSAEALVAGDYLLAASMAGFASVGAQSLQIITSALQDICLGQLRETQDLYDRNRSEQSYLVSVTGKTAELMAACAQIGTLIAGGGEQEQDSVSSYARSLGIAFQIWDDIRDIWPPTDGTGKAPGKDIDNGVFTLPVIYGFRADRAEFERLLDDSVLTPERHRVIRAFLDRHGAQQRSIRTAQQHIQAGLLALGQLPAGPGNLPGRLTAVASALMPEARELLLSVA